MAFIGFN